MEKESAYWYAHPLMRISLFIMLLAVYYAACHIAHHNRSSAAWPVNCLLKENGVRKVSDGAKPQTVFF